MSNFRAMNARFAVSPQLGRADFAAAKAAGYVMVICHRPDNEEPGQLNMEEAASLAGLAGMAFRAAPFAGALTQEAYDVTAKALAEADGPVLAYCRSGTRSSIVWAFVEASRGSEIAGLIHAAAAQGYDLRPHQAALLEFQRLGQG